jgi:DNA-binding NarL/FixJ family response regulator
MITEPRERVLLIEDDEDIAERVVRILAQKGFRPVREAARRPGVERAKSEAPDVVIVDLQIPSDTGRADEDTAHGLGALAEIVALDPFRPIVVCSAHGGTKELAREVYRYTRGGPFVFKDSETFDEDLFEAIGMALAQPAYRASKTVAAFRALVGANIDAKKNEHAYRRFIHEHWEVILGPDYKECHSPYSIGRAAEIDILAVRHDGFADLWELKRPDTPLFRPYGQWLGHSPECASAIGQLMHSYDAAAREPQGGALHFEGRRGLDLYLNRPRGFVVLGRYSSDPQTAKVERERLRLENSFYAGLTVLTYDDLIERATSLLDFLLRHRNGSARA